MVSINTNLSSLRVQANLTNSTNGLNKAIERLSTGYKINHSSDNAANYSIANSYESKLSSYDMAASNVSMGLDLLSVAQDTISTMQDHGSRLHALITQARNGTYGTQSLTALTQEAGALISEINRMYSNTEYNNVSLFDNFPLPEWAKEVKAEAGKNAGIEEGETVGLTKDLTPKYNGFIENPETYTKEKVAAMTKVEDVESFTAGETYSISTKEELAKLATKVNGGANTTNVEFVLGADIDLSSIENWTPIGNYSNQFKGTFDGNGHVIENLKINNSTTDYQGLFGCASSASTIKNIGIVDCNIIGKDRAAGLVSGSFGNVTNSYATGTVKGSYYVGGIAGYSSKTIDNCYSTCTVTSTNNNGGDLVGYANGGEVKNSFATGDVIGTNNNMGGLIGYSNCAVNNCYSTGSVSGASDIGGLVGQANTSATVANSYATGSVTGTGNYTGGLVGYANSVTNSYATGSVTGYANTGGLGGYCCNVTNSFATGSVTGENYTGGLVGYAYGAVTNSYATGSVIGTFDTGGLVGMASYSSVTNSYATGLVTGTGSCTGGLVGIATNGSVSNSYATGTVTGSTYAGGLVGVASVNSISNSYATGSVTSTDNNTGGLVGVVSNGSISNSYATGNVTGTQYIGGFVGLSGGSSVTNSYATGNITGASWVGGLVGQISNTSGTVDYDKLFSSGKVTGDDIVGSLIGGIVSTNNGTSFGTINITNAKVLKSGLDVIGFEGKFDGTAYESGQMESWLENIKQVKSPETTLQVGIYGDESNQITFDTGFEYDLSAILKDIKSDDSYNAINKFMSTLSDKATEMGSVSNRLESALDSIIVNMENVTSSLSTIKDADVATTSSQYIKMQILQQASATLLATANQSPSIALQLI